MGLFGKLFGKKDKQDNNNSDNNKLIRLLDKWGREESEHCFKAVLHELFEGQSFLLFPTDKNTTSEDKWIANIGGESLHLSSVRDEEGVHEIAVFTDDTSLTEWTKQISTYSTLKTQELFELCRNLEIDRIVINSGLSNMFILERKKEEDDADEENTMDSSRVRVGIPNNPLSLIIIQKINENVAQVPFIDEVYQYIKEEISEQGSEFILMIGVRMSENSDENTETMLDAIKQALTNQKKPNLPLGIMVMDDKWLKTMETISNPPFYRKEQAE